MDVDAMLAGMTPEQLIEWRIALDVLGLDREQAAVETVQAEPEKKMMTPSEFGAFMRTMNG